MQKSGNYTLNKSHLGALFGEDYLQGAILNTQTIRKKVYANKGITPMHLACISHSPAVLHRFFRIFPSPSLADEDRRNLIHYAAASESSACLEFFIQKGSELNIADA